MMRYSSHGGLGLASVLALALAGGPALAQPSGSGTYAYPHLPADDRIPNILPTGSPDQHGFYATAEALFVRQTHTLGKQIVAYRGLVDSTGNVTGTPGTYIGNRQVALNTDDFPRKSVQPGVTFGLGYSFGDGTSIYGSYTHINQVSYHAGATLVTPYFNARPDLADTFLFSPVYNFPPQFAGVGVKTSFDVGGENIQFGATGQAAIPSIANSIGGNFYGIWNGASVMDIQFDQWYNAANLGVRSPIFQTEYSRIYGLAGAQYNMFMERFRWRTVSFRLDGVAQPEDVALYNNTLSQRMYGAFVGCSHEVFLGSGFSAALDTTAAGLLNVVKERAKYKLGSDLNQIQNKLSRNEFTFVPNVNVAANLMWHPIEGVQLRVGYSANMFFNTMDMRNPIGFNYSNIDPVYETRGFRIIHGVNAGVGLFF